jgi:ATP synthase F1 epsilon subunit
MARAFDLKVVTPNEVYFEGKAVSVVAPGALGYLGVLRDHAPFVTTLDKGNLSYKDETDQVRTFKIEGGFFEVFQNRVLVLTDKIKS